MPCFSLTESKNKNSCFRSNFRSNFIRAGLLHPHRPQRRRHHHALLAPQNPHPSKPNLLLLLHGLGPKATWQFSELIRHVTPYYNVYVPDLLFFIGISQSYQDRFAE